MPRAGWCRECGEWVWVDADDACQHGHGADCVERVYEASPSAPDDGSAEDRRPLGAPLPVTETPRSPGFGDGSLPEELARFNWGAFLLPLPWSVVYGAWPIFLGWVAAWMVTFFGAIALAGDATVVPASARVLSFVAVGTLQLYAGFSANSIAWGREARRLEVLEGSKPRFSVLRYRLRQRLWIFAGVVWTVLELASHTVVGLATGPEVEALREQYQITPAVSAAAVMFIVAEVALAFWLAGKMRQEGLGTGTGEGADGTV